MGVGWGLRVEVEVLDDERTSTPAIFKGPRAVSHPTCCCASLDRCDLLVGLEGFHLMSVVRTPDALVLDVESCNQLAGCPGCGVNRSRPRACGGGGDRRALGRGPCADLVAQYGAGYVAPRGIPCGPAVSASRI